MRSKPTAGQIARAVLTTPQDARAAFAWSGHLLDESEAAGAFAWARRARFIQPDASPPWNREAVALWRLNRLSASCDAARRAAMLDPAFASPWINIAALVKRRGFDDVALQNYRRAEIVGGQTPTIALNKAVILLRMGDYLHGWDLYRARHQAMGIDAAAIWPGLPEWDGGALRGRLRVLAEQGIGDTVMFLTLMQAVLSHVEAVTLLVSDRLAALMRRSFPGIDVATPDGRGCLPDLAPAAAWICAGDLPAILGLFTGGSARPLPYLRPDRRRTERLRNLLRRRAPGCRLIGITWTSRAEDGWRRSIPPALWRPLSDLSGCRLVSLQYGADPRDLATFGDTVDWDHGIEPLADLDGLAALVAAVDLVVTPANNTAHFAGASGVPCHVLLPEDPDWRWGATGSGNRWYPQTQLHRQTRENDWSRLLQRICETVDRPASAST